MKILDYDLYHFKHKKNVKSRYLNNQYDIFNVINFIGKMLPDGIINIYTLIVILTLHI